MLEEHVPAPAEAAAPLEETDRTPDGGAADGEPAGVAAAAATAALAGDATEVAGDGASDGATDGPADGLSGDGHVGATDGAAADGTVAPPEAAPPPVQPPPPPDLSPAACAQQLSERFPALFAAGQPLPIKLRIQADIQARAPGVFTRKAMSLFLHRHTTTTAYLKALVAAPHRFDLDGAPAGEVLPEHREAAVAEVERRRAIVESRRAAEREARRPPRPPGAEGQPPLQRPGADARPGTGDRPPRRDGPPRVRQQPPSRQAQRPDRPQQADRSQQPDRSGRRDPLRQPDPPRQPSPRGPREAGPPDAAAAHPQPPSPASLQPQLQPQPQQPQFDPAELAARRERAALLRAYESSPLTKANFCVLKRIGEAELDAQLALARQDGARANVRPPR